MLISLFITCYNDTLFPETGKAVVRVLEALGHTVEFRPAQTCCGQMHLNTGYRPDASRLMEKFVADYAGAEVICIPSASCVATIRESYPEMAEAIGDPELVKRVRETVARVFEFSELLIDKLGVEVTGATFPHSVAYHSSCHSLRSLQIGDRPYRLLRGVRDLKLVDLPDCDRCCGFGGTFAIKNADVSAAMLEEKIDSILSTGAEVVTAGDNSCLMHIYGGLHRQGAPIRVVHLAEILAADCEPKGREANAGTSQEAEV